MVLHPADMAADIAKGSLPITSDESASPEAGAAGISPEAGTAEPGEVRAGPPMRVLDSGGYRGPHVYGSLPMVRIQVDLGALEAWPSHMLPGFSRFCPASASMAAAITSPAASSAACRTEPSSAMGDTPVEQRVREIHDRGGVVAGTSAGASVMSETMLVKGTSGESYKIGNLHMAPGLGLVRNAIIDRHFAERGRFGRLFGAVAHNPRDLGIGIDEDTALVLQGDQFEVIGSGCVYGVGGAGVTRSNIAKARPERALSMYDVRLHVLSSEDAFDMARRRPTEMPDVQTRHAIEVEAGP